ncbi:MAG: type VI secretion system baseplate subunit TssG [Comamonadaceae bacterium]|nr:MAG: type VI secretion system baseplate subunit TssG [Comamonadaceae bacterium]
MPAVTLDLSQAFVRDGAAFAYFQALRLMRRQESVQGRATTIRVRPKLSLGFPDTDLDRIEPLPDGAGWRVTANFFGLYGVTSPLPTYYSEDLLDDEREGQQARREFLDIFHHALYPQLFLAWRKYRLHLRAVEEKDPHALGTLFSFAGLGLSAQRQKLQRAPQLLRQLGLFAMHTRSALGLQTLLADAFAPAQVAIDSCVLQHLPIPAAQRLQLGLKAHVLGEESYLGMEIEDSDNLLRISMSALPADLFQQLLPGAEGYARLRFLTRFYLTRPLQIDLALSLAPGERPGLQLGARSGVRGAWSRLGLDTWLGADAVPTEDARPADATDAPDGADTRLVTLRLPQGMPIPSIETRGIAHAVG